MKYKLCDPHTMRDAGLISGSVGHDPRFEFLLETRMSGDIIIIVRGRPRPAAPLKRYPPLFVDPIKKQKRGEGRKGREN
jgi:hypothetical protein